MDATLLAQVPIGTEQQATSLMQWLLNQGPWAFFTAVFMLLFYWGARALFGHVVIPLKDAGIRHLEAVSDHLKGVSTTMKDTTEAVCKLGVTLDGVHKKLECVDQKTTIIVDEYRGLIEESRDDRKDIHDRLGVIEQKISCLPKMVP